jgi:ribulose-5-phosphate 4-epimerase/fuculose-1-phosphate aldolase
MSTESKLREEICRIGASLYSRGYTVGTAGNISARLEDGFLITPTDACLGDLDPARLSKLDAAGEQQSGDRASKTIRVHRAVYGADTSLRAVVHTHSTHLVALSLTPGVDTTNIIPLIPYCRPGDPKMVDLVLPFVPHVRGVMLARIGPTFWHESVSNAAYAIEEAEETAKLWFLTHNARLPALGEEEIAELKSNFEIKW